MITEDPLETFPACPTYGFSVDPWIEVKNTMRAGGYVTSDRKWQHPLRRFTGVPTGNRPQADIEAILYFWLCVGGLAGRFRFKDWTDYKSALLDNDVTPTDQPIELISGSPSGFQLVKRYVHGALAYTRTVTRPLGSTLRVANELGAEQASTRWTIDEVTGILYPEPTFVGTPTSWGGEFDVYARFDGPFIPEISNHKIQNASCSICETREQSL